MVIKCLTCCKEVTVKKRVDIEVCPRCGSHILVTVDGGYSKSKNSQRNKEIWTLYQSDVFYWNSKQLADRFDLTEKQVKVILDRFRMGECKGERRAEIEKFIKENPGVSISNHPAFVG